MSLFSSPLKNSLYAALRPFGPMNSCASCFGNVCSKASICGSAFLRISFWSLSSSCFFSKYFDKFEGETAWKFLTLFFIMTVAIPFSISLCRTS